MKNKKGFTLIEIIVVIAIIGIILIIAIPTTLLISKSIKERAYEAKWTSLIAAAELYGKNNKDAFGEATQIQIPVETLLAYGYITSDSTYCERTVGCIIDPRDEKTIMNDEPITIRKNKSAVQVTQGVMTVDLKIYFVGNGAEIGVTSLGCSTLNGSVCTVKLPSITRSGYTILGWNENASATISIHQAGENFELSNSNNGVTYYAITSKPYTATFNKNNASAISATSANCNIYNKKTSCNVTTPTITASSGGVAVGWNTSSSATTSQYNVSATIPLTSNITYYAITSKTYTVTFNKNSASAIGATSASCKIYNNAATSCNVTAPTITASSGYNVVGWNTNASASCTIYNIIQSCNVTAPTITASSGYDVVGWNTSSSATTYQYKVSSTIPLSSNITYYAIQKKKSSGTSTTPTATSCSCSYSCKARNADGTYIYVNGNYVFITETLSGTINTVTTYYESAGQTCERKEDYCKHSKGSKCGKTQCYKSYISTICY